MLQAGMLPATMQKIFSLHELKNKMLTAFVEAAFRMTSKRTPPVWQTWPQARCVAAPTSKEVVR